MSLKKLLGLDTCPLSEQEIIKKIDEASKNKQEEIVFTCKNNKKVKIRLSQVSSMGLMNDYKEYFA